MATFVMFTSAETQKAVVINIEKISTILDWITFDTRQRVTRIYMVGDKDEGFDVAENFDQVLDKVGARK